MDHVALADVQHALLLAGLDEGFDVLLADERPLLRIRVERRGDDPREDEQPRDEWPGEPGDEIEREHHQQQHLLGMASADGARHEEAE